MTSFDALIDATDELAAKWAAERPERQRRRHLEHDDFAALADAGLLRAIVPLDQGGMWTSAAQTARPLCGVLRTLAAADSSVALVSAMHPAVLSFWMASPDPDQPRWEEQRRAVAATAYEGMQWGTVTSEPGSGGDIARTRTTAEPLDGGAPAPRTNGQPEAPPGDRHVLNGDKHFGSGLGVTDFMFTTARPQGEDDPAAFVLDVRGLDLTAGPVEVIAEWDGAGMAATQSHAVRLHDAPATRLAWCGTLPELQLANGGFVLALFTSVVLGVVDAAVQEADRVLTPRRDSLRPYEQLEWARPDRPLGRGRRVRTPARHDRASRPHREPPRRPAREGRRRRAQRERPVAAHPRDRWRRLHAAVAVLPLVRGRPSARLPAAAVGARLRQPHRVLVTRRARDPTTT